MSRYETPTALRHDASKLAEDARALLEATADVTDEKITQARERLFEALADGKQSFGRLRERASQGIRATDRTIRKNPYESMAVALGIGALIGYFLARRD